VGKIVLPLEQLTYEWVFGLYLVCTSRTYCDFEVEPNDCGNTWTWLSQVTQFWQNYHKFL